MKHPDPDLDVTRALEAVTVPAYVLDRQGRFRWLNQGAIDVVGERVGESFTRVVAREDLHEARTHFARKLIGESDGAEHDLRLLCRDGRRLAVRVSSAPLCERGEIVGVFAIAYPAPPGAEAVPAPTVAVPELTARQYEALALLADGLGTSAIAGRLGVAEETARNHIRALIRQLGVHSRLEAVVHAYRLGILHVQRDN